MLFLDWPIFSKYKFYLITINTLLTEEATLIPYNMSTLMNDPQPFVRRDPHLKHNHNIILCTMVLVTRRWRKLTVCTYKNIYIRIHKTLYEVNFVELNFSSEGFICKGLFFILLLNNQQYENKTLIPFSYG